MDCVAIRHVPCEDLGALEPVIKSQFDLHYIDMPPDGRLTPDLELAREATLVVSLGGPMAAYEEDQYPWLAGEIEILRERITTGRGTLGICLGSQLIAAAAGARVYAAGHHELGWFPIQFTYGAEMDPVLSRLVEGDNTFLHWHGDAFDLPAGGRLLGASALCEHQGFRLGRHVIALQFHAEVDGAVLEKWLDAYAGKLPEAGKGVMSPDQLREGARRFGPGVTRRVRSFMVAWLGQLFAGDIAGRVTR